MTDQPSDREGAMLPCPFCGGKASAVRNSFPPRSRYWHPTCETDGCPGQVDEQDEMGGTVCDCSSKAAAIATWNTRAPMAEQEGARGGRDGEPVAWLRFAPHTHQGTYPDGTLIPLIETCRPEERGAFPVFMKQPEQEQAEPLPMILPCPSCGRQHVDAPEPEKGWTNPPHKSHLCHGCGTIWRPADVPTNGVAAITTTGSKDTWKAEQKQAARGDQWVDVSDRKPDEEQDVLAVTPAWNDTAKHGWNVPLVLRYAASRWLDADGASHAGYDPTYWMPLPAPPVKAAT